MTTDQAVNRQADHENLIRELVAMLKEIHTTWVDIDLYEQQRYHDSKLAKLIDKAEDQGYA